MQAPRAVALGEDSWKMSDIRGYLPLPLFALCLPVQTEGRTSACLEQRDWKTPLGCSETLVKQRLCPDPHSFFLSVTPGVSQHQE